MTNENKLLGSINVAECNVDAARAVFGSEVSIEVPEMSAPYLENLFDSIDAAFFSGDAFFDENNRIRAIAYLQRWGRELAKFEKDDSGEREDILLWLESIEGYSIDESDTQLSGKIISVSEHSEVLSSEVTQTMRVNGVEGTLFEFTRTGHKVITGDRWTGTHWYGWEYSF